HVAAPPARRSGHDGRGGSEVPKHQGFVMLRARRRAERRNAMRITVKTESGSTHTVLLPTGSGTSKQEAMLLLTAAHVREGRAGLYYEGWLEVEARSETDSLWIRHDTIIEVLLEPMDDSPTLTT